MQIFLEFCLKFFSFISIFNFIINVPYYSLIRLVVYLAKFEYFDVIHGIPWPYPDLMTIGPLQQCMHRFKYKYFPNRDSKCDYQTCIRILTYLPEVSKSWPIIQMKKSKYLLNSSKSLILFNIKANIINTTNLKLYCKE